MRSFDLSSLTHDLRAVLTRFPLPLVAAAVVTLSLIIGVEAGGDDDLIFRISILGGLAFVAGILVDLLFESKASNTGKRTVTHGVVLLLIGLYGWFVFPQDLDNSLPVFWYGHCILMFCLHLGIALVPLCTGRDSTVLWRFNVRLFLRYFFSSINAAIIYIGVALAILCVDRLFGISIDEERYLQLWLFCAFFLHPVLLLGGIPRHAELTADQAFPKALAFSLKFIGVPLAALYLVIIYAYVGKIILQWSWPNGWVAMPIFILSVISLLTYVLSHPLATTESWARLYHRWLYRLLLPLSIVLFLALQVRLSDYGMTINRYLGLALAVWLFGISVLYLIRPKLHVACMPATLLGVCLFAICPGPLGAFGWSLRSQTARIESSATELNCLKEGTLLPLEVTTNPDAAEQLKSSLQYVISNYGTGAIEPLLSDYFAQNQNTSRRPRYQASRVIDHLNLNTAGTQHRYYGYSEQVTPTYAKDWSLHFRYYASNRGDSDHESSERYPEHGLDITGTQQRLIILAENTAPLEIDLTEWIPLVLERVDISDKSETPLVWHYTVDDWSYSILLTNAQIEDDATPEFRSYSLTILFTAPE